jgi:hypothetical protein
LRSEKRFFLAKCRGLPGYLPVAMFEEIVSEFECKLDVVEWSIKLINNNITFLDGKDLKRLHIYNIGKKEINQLEFESDITLIGHFDNLLILGDSDGFVCLLDALDPIGKDVLFGPIQLSHSPLVSFQENYIKDSNLDWYQLQRGSREDGSEFFSFSKVSFDPPINYLMKTEVVSWPLESMRVEQPIGQTLICTGSSPMLSLRREATEISLVKLATTALNIFNPKRKKKLPPPTPDLIVAEVDYEIIEKLDDPGREFSKLISLSDDLIACIDARRAQVFILNPKLFILVKQFKGYRDSLINCYEDEIVLVSNKRKILEIWEREKNQVGAIIFSQRGETKNFDEKIHFIEFYSNKRALIKDTTDEGKTLIKLVRLSF